MSFRHKCANPSCPNVARAGEFSCQSCWSRLPRNLRKVIFEAWSDGGWRSTNYTYAVKAARTWWKEHPHAA